MGRKGSSVPAEPAIAGASGGPDPTLEDVVGAIGPKLRDLRHARGLSLQQLAALSQVSAAAIHKVERGDMVPTITTLLKLALALQRPIGYFIDDLATEFEVASYTPASDRARVDSSLPGLTLEDIAGPTSRFRIRAVHATVAPGAASDDSDLASGGEHLLVMLDGTLTVKVQGRDYTLRSGDTLHFPNDRTHSWRNPGRSAARLLWISLPR